MFTYSKVVTQSPGDSLNLTWAKSILVGATWGGSDFSQNCCLARKSRASQLDCVFGHAQVGGRVGKIHENTEHFPRGPLSEKWIHI